MIRRRQFLACTVSLACAAVWSVSAQAEASATAFPSRPVHLVLGSPAGSSVDVLARLLAEKISATLGQPVVVENRVGATGTIATAHIAKAAPDGYRVLLQHSGAFTNSILSKSVQYNVLNDFTPISFVTISPLVLIAGPGLQAETLEEVIELAKNDPGKLTYGSEGTGGTSHVATELFSQLAGIKMTHVPYKSGFYSTSAVASGEINMAFASTTSILPLLKAGKYRALAVGTKERSPLLESVPTVHESGAPGFDQAAWFGFVGPAGMDDAVVEKLHGAISEAAQHPEVVSSLNAQGMQVRLMGPQQFAAYLEQFAGEIKRVADTAGISLD